jgi:hypothetical protein
MLFLLVFAKQKLWVVGSVGTFRMLRKFLICIVCNLKAVGKSDISLLGGVKLIISKTCILNRHMQ